MQVGYNGEMRRWYTVPAILMGALVITALGIDAADTFSGSRGTLLAGLLFKAPVAPHCMDGTVPLKTELQTYCVDTYEASVSADCPHPESGSAVQTASNILAPRCVPTSMAGVLPWRFATRAQAEQLCARVGKQLITPLVWYQASLGTADSLACTTKGDLQVTGHKAGCRSGIGAFDMLGNVWELVSGDVVNGIFEDTLLPPSGYVSGITAAGIPVSTQSTSSLLYQDDYVWTNATGTYAVMRGGFYGGATDAGLYSMQATIPLDFSSGAIGFRCMQIL